uniref:glycoside hydrolase family 2 TIM barrel-domain containing protein n=1 Tax=Herbidospora sakaeratensis TaxID=564415 RepID=UPI000AC3461D|nr:glycoside hydrolase family 2 TIM barrel-domain containing protein [Herbidospora sakaeratensis]
MKARRTMATALSLSLFISTLISLVALTVAAPSATAAETRSHLNFNRGWKFLRKDVTGASNVGFNDASWVAVGLPHNFDAPYDVGGSAGGDSFHVGPGWYRKTFDVPAEWSQKTVEIEFEGAANVADVWVNGTKAGTHRGGFTGFTFDIGRLLRPGSNLVAVRVDNGWKADLAPRTGDHQFMGGLYRDVFLNVTDKVHVTWYGTFVTTPALTNPVWDTSNAAYYRNIDLSQYPGTTALQANLDARRSNVRVQTEVRNDRTTSSNVMVRHVVTRKGATTALATFTSSTRTLAAGQTATIDALSGGLGDTGAMVQNLDLWAPDNPALYTVTTSVIVDGAQVDDYQTVFGFRSAQWKADGFYLNGRKTLLVGANAHQDHGGWGNAVTNAGLRRDVEMIREAGMNFIRGSHYPHDPAYSQATDELGVMMWAESDYWHTATAGREGAPVGSSTDYLKDGYPQNSSDQAAFEQSALDHLGAMIRMERNRPSIINWSMGNEAFFTASGTMAKAKALVSRMRDHAHLLDPTRKAAMGGVQRQSFDQLSIADIAGYNGDGGKMTNTWMPNIVSEYGSHTSDRPGLYAPTFGDIADPADTSRFKLTTGSAGLAIWAGFDHGTVFGASLARMGMIDYYRLPKAQWYWYRANKSLWTGLTRVNDARAVAREQSVSGTATKMSLAVSKYGGTTIANDGSGDTQLVVTMLNAANQWVNQTRQVKLTVTSGPGGFPGGKTYTFVPGRQMFDGRAAIEFRSYYAGTTTITASSSGLPDATLQITTADTAGAGPESEPPYFGDSSRWGEQITTVTPPVAYPTDNQAVAHPMDATSEQSGRGKAFAADGDPSTWWAAGTTGANQSVTVFLEQARHLYKVRVDFPDGPLPYTVAVRNAGGTWTDVVRHTAGTVAARPVEDSLDGVYAEYVRVSFPDLTSGQRAAVGELTVLGNLAITPRYAADGAYLSDVVDFSGGVTTSSGAKGKDQTSTGRRLTLGGVAYDKGIGLQSASSVTFATSGRYARIVGVAGLDDEVTGGDATFLVYADDQLIYTKRMSAATVLREPFDLSISGAARIRLVTDANGSAANDSIDWADVRLIGAVRDLSKAGSRLETTFAALTDQLQAGTPYRAGVTVANTGTAARGVRAGITLYDNQGAVLDSRVSQVSVPAGDRVTVNLTLPMPNSVTGRYATVSVSDPATLDVLSAVAWLGPDPARSTYDVPAWTTKTDGESSSIVKTGSWARWDSSAAYQGTETFVNTSGATMAYTFTGEYARIGAKFDGSQSGFTVFVDGTQVATVSTQVGDGSNTYRVAWTSARLAAGPHTVRIVTTGKAGIDYFESGIATST